MNAIFEIIFFIWSILCLILFFKIWGATNTLDKIHDLLANKLANIEKPTQESVSIKEDETAQMCAKDSLPQSYDKGSDDENSGDKKLILILGIIIVFIVIIILMAAV